MHTSIDQTRNDRSESLLDQTRQKYYSVDSALQQVGGFGRFQFAITLALTILRNSGMYYYYGFGFLTLEQTYLCRTNPNFQFESCSAETICSQQATPGFQFIENTADSDYVMNWQQDMGLMCTSRSVINYMITAYFVAYGFAGLLLFPIPDKVGSRQTLWWFGTAHLVAQFAILFVTSFWMRVAMMAVLGACQLKNSTCYVWMFGLIQRKHASMCCGLLNTWDTVTLTVLTLYFRYWNKNWFYLYFSLTVLGALSMLFMMVLAPESPKWLILQGRKKEAISAFNNIAKLNGSKERIEDDAIFEEENLPRIGLNTSAISELSQLVGPKATSDLKTLVLLVISSAQMFFCLYIALYSLTALPGDKMFAGMAFGLAESSSNLISGYICTKFKDQQVFTGFCLLIVFSMSFFYFVCGGQSGSIASLISIFLTVLGCGSNINIIYLMIELRIPTEKLGSTIVVVITGSVFYTTGASFVAYSDQPIPYVTGVVMALLALVTSNMLSSPTQVVAKPIVMRRDISDVTSSDVTFGAKPMSDCGFLTPMSQKEADNSLNERGFKLGDINRSPQQGKWDFTGNDRRIEKDKVSKL